jgi:hypothetical protein
VLDFSLHFLRMNNNKPILDNNFWYDVDVCLVFVAYNEENFVADLVDGFAVEIF